ncbi:MAG: IclR family transcriptional regulator domain-containing protein [Woeseiaceae bacterium]|jgi:hypothetical protein
MVYQVNTQYTQLCNNHFYVIAGKENKLGRRCIAAPAFDDHGENAADISVSGQTIRILDADIEDIGQAVMDAAATSESLATLPISIKGSSARFPFLVPRESDGISDPYTVPFNIQFIITRTKSNRLCYWHNKET